MKYKIGNNVVHLHHGVGEIAAIETREFTKGKTTTFYVLLIQDNGAPKKVFVEVGQENNIRPIMAKTTANRVIAMLNSDLAAEDVDSQTWNRRYLEYMELIHSGEPEAITRVIVSLRKLKAEKDLSFGERKLLEQAINLIKKELELVPGIGPVFVSL